jgi:hypothetical protein
MNSKEVVPKRLYKYRAFSALTMDLLVGDKVYFADPSTFNDPLDTRPSLNPDLDVPALASALQTLVERRIAGEMTAAAKTIKYRGPKTLDHIERHSRQQAERLLADIAYNATNPEYTDSSPGPHLALLGHQMERELLRQYDKGILSLAERFTCPLMWSHYADQHNGLCIGYSVPEDAAANLHKVHYGGSRMVEASRVAEMLAGDQVARRHVDTAVLLRKARDWKYEKEWRLIGPRGLADSPLELESVTFGTRCLSAVKYAVAKALAGRERDARLYEMQEVHGTFELKRYLVDLDELGVSYPRRARSGLEAFQAIE